MPPHLKSLCSFQPSKDLLKCSHLEVGEGAGGVGVGARLAAALPRLDGRVQIIVVNAAQGVRAAVEGRAQDQLVARTPKRLPQQHAVVLQQEHTQGNGVILCYLFQNSSDV